MELHQTANEPIANYNTDLIYKDESFEIISCCMEVHKSLGKGFLEVVYKDALSREFSLRGINYVREKKYNIMYKGLVLPHSYCSDFVVYDKIILEIKAQENVINENYRQVINYLAVSKCKLGLLINFGEDNLKFKRVVL